MTRRPTTPARRRLPPPREPAERATRRRPAPPRAAPERGPTTAPERTPAARPAPSAALRSARQVVSSTSVRRFAERARARRRMTWRNVAWSMAAVAVLALAAWVVLASPVLAVRSIEVTGTARVPAGDVVALAERARGVPLVRVDTGAIGDELRALAPVRSVEVERSWPSTLRISVAERQALAVVPAPDGTFDVVDAEGVVLDSTAQAPAGVPLVQVDVTAAGGRTVREAVEVLGALPTDLRAQVTTVSATTRDSVTVALASGARVFWGSADDSGRKAEVLAVLLKTPASEYDVSSPDTPVTR